MRLIFYFYLQQWIGWDILIDKVNDMYENNLNKGKKDNK